MNDLFNNEHLILICFFLLIDNEFDSKITLRVWNPEINKNINENPPNIVIFKIVFTFQRRKLRREKLRIQLFKNRKVQISKRWENVKSYNRIIQKSKKFKYPKDVKM